MIERGLRWRFFTRSDYEEFLTALVETTGAGGIAGYRLDESIPAIGVGRLQVQVRHRLRNLLRPARRHGIAQALQEAIDYGRPVAIQVEVVASCVPLWLRRAP